MKKLLFLLILLQCVVVKTYSQSQSDSLLKVEVAISEGDYNKALLLLNQSSQDKTLRYFQLKGIVYENIGRYDSSSIAYRNAMEFDSAYIPAIKGYARSLYSYGNIKLAKKEYEEILKLDSLCVNTRLQYATVLKKEGDYAKAFFNYCWLTNYDSTNFYFWDQRADCATQVNNYLDAINSYNIAISLNKQNLDIVVKYVKLLISLQVPTEDLITEVDSALKVDSLYVPLLKIKGKLYADQKKYKKSLEVFTTVYELGDSSFFTSKYLGINKYSTGLYYQSIPDFERAFKRDSSDSFLNFVYSSALFQIGDRNKALKVANFTENMLTPDSSLVAVIYDLKGDINFENRDYTLAVECYDKAQKYSNGNMDFVFKIGKTYFQMKDYSTSMKYLNDYLEKVDDGSEKSKSRSNIWLAKHYIDKIKEENFFRDTIVTKRVQ
ncbi:MAG: tetratricopeptide repeat protein [Bacteroidales bacterium]